MKRNLLAGAGLAALIAASFPALAADIRMPSMPAKAPAAVVAPAYSWTGCHIGAHGGYGWGEKGWSESDDGSTFLDQKVDGWLAGGQVGCDWQSNRFVFGIEGQMAWAGLSGTDTRASSSTTESVFQSRVDALGIVVGRLGVAFDRTLLYVNGGFAFAKDWHRTSFFDDGELIDSNETGKFWRTGWTVGGGIEHAFADNWSLKLEYNYMDFGTKTVRFTECAPQPCGELQFYIPQHIHAIKFGVNYRFNFNRPVVARY